MAKNNIEIYGWVQSKGPEINLFTQEDDIVGGWAMEGYGIVALLEEKDVDKEITRLTAENSRLQEIDSAYDDAMCASNELGYACMSAGDVIRHQADELVQSQSELAKARELQPLIDQVGEAYKFLALCRADKTDDAVETFALRDAYDWLRNAGENLGKALINQSAPAANFIACKVDESCGRGCSDE